jgi:transcriptional regulator with XRE-family HTH domain
MTHWRSQTETKRKRLAAKLREAREAANLTQREVARRLTIPQSTISELENGQRRLDVAELLLLAELYGVPAVWFLDGDRPETTAPSEPAETPSPVAAERPVGDA